MVTAGIVVVVGLPGVTSQSQPLSVYVILAKFLTSLFFSLLMGKMGT